MWEGHPKKGVSQHGGALGTPGGHSGVMGGSLGGMGVMGGVQVLGCPWIGGDLFLGGPGGRGSVGVLFWGVPEHFWFWGGVKGGP